MQIDQAEDFEAALFKSLPPNRWQPAILALVRAWYGSALIPGWPAEIEFDFEEDRHLLNFALRRMAARPEVEHEGSLLDWNTARLIRHAVAPRQPPELPPQLTLKETKEAHALLAKLDEAFMELPKPQPFTDMRCSHMVQESEAFTALDWDTANYEEFHLAQEGWICAPTETKIWLLPKLLRIVLLNRDHLAVDNISMDLEEFHCHQVPEFRTHLTKRQQDAAMTTLNYYFDWQPTKNN